jgi:hypothetical protein
LPNGRIGTVVGLFFADASANGAIAAHIDPTPIAPSDFRNERLEFLFPVSDIVSPFIPSMKIRCKTNLGVAKK